MWYISPLLWIYRYLFIVHGIFKLLKVRRPIYYLLEFRRRTFLKCTVYQSFIARILVFPSTFDLWVSNKVRTNIPEGYGVCQTLGNIKSKYEIKKGERHTGSSCSWYSVSGHPGVVVRVVVYIFSISHPPTTYFSTYLLRHSDTCSGTSGCLVRTRIDEGYKRLKGGVVYPL